MNSGESKVKVKPFHINISVAHIQSINLRCVENKANFSM